MPIMKREGKKVSRGFGVSYGRYLNRGLAIRGLARGGSLKAGKCWRKKQRNC